MADKEHPEAYEDLLQAKPKYKDREVDSPVLTAEIRALIDKELEQNAVKLATGLQKLFDTYFADKPRDFVELLIWGKDNNYDYQELCSAVNVAKMKGIHTITLDSLKTVLVDNRSSEQVLDLPWSQTIEDGAAINLSMLGNMFKSDSKGVQS